MPPIEPALSDQDNQRPSWFVPSLILVTVSIILSTMAFQMYSKDRKAISEPMSELIGSQMADAAAPLVLSGNQLALQALAQKAVMHDIVAHAAFYNLRNELLAQAGPASLAGTGTQIRREISMQKRLLGYTRLSLQPTLPGLINGRTLTFCSMVLALLGLGLWLRAGWFLPRASSSEEKPKSALVEKQTRKESYQQFEEPDGEYGIVAVELLQLPLMRKQLSEDTLYEYLTTFESWLEQVAALYSAAIRVGETGFTLTLKESDGFDDNQALVTRTTHCSYALMQTMNVANEQRSARSEPVFEVRIGTHISSPLQNDARLLRELYAQDAHRQAWQACAAKAAGTVSLSQSVVGHPDCSDMLVSAQDSNGFYELRGFDPETLQFIEHRLQLLAHSS